MFYSFFPPGVRSSWYSDYSCPITVVCVLSQGNCAWFVVLCGVLKLFCGIKQTVPWWALGSVVVGSKCPARGAEPCLELHLPQREQPGPWGAMAVLQFCRCELIPEYSFHCSSVCSECRAILGHVEVRCVANRTRGAERPFCFPLRTTEVVPGARQVAASSPPVRSVTATVRDSAGWVCSLLFVCWVKYKLSTGFPVPILLFGLKA